jgi:5-(carboxyamino)imidazole ribonucleotide mutase
MPGGVPVATVALNGSKNAGILAAQIIGTNSETVRKSLEKLKHEMAVSVEQKAARIEMKTAVRKKK